MNVQSVCTVATTIVGVLTSDDHLLGRGHVGQLRSAESHLFVLVIVHAAGTQYNKKYVCVNTSNLWPEQYDAVKNYSCQL